jgi:ureidoglycolate hydrolase
MWSGDLSVEQWSDAATQVEADMIEEHAFNTQALIPLGQVDWRRGHSA